MKRMIIPCFAILITLSFFLFGCSGEIIAPDSSGKIRVELLNVEITFDLNAQRISLFNKNWNCAHIEISRYTPGWGDDPWLDIVNVCIWGRCSRDFTAYFETGDEIEIYVRVEDLENWMVMEIGS